MDVISVKCKKCRNLLFLHPEFNLLDAHGVLYSKRSIEYVDCKSIQESNLWFLHESKLPTWISDLVDKSNWTKGRLSCPHCQGRLGSFDFISGSKCLCLKHFLPAIHLVKSKVDCKSETK